MEAKAAGEIASVIMELRRFTTPRKTPPADAIISHHRTDRHNTPVGSPPPPVTDGEHGGLLDALTKVPDPA